MLSGEVRRSTFTRNNVTVCTVSKLPTYIWMLFDHAVLADVDTVFEAKLIGDLTLGTLAQTHLDLIGQNK